MAEVLIRVKDGANAEDGDIICAFNDNRIKNMHAGKICNHWNTTPNEHGLLDLDTHYQKYLELTSEYKFERSGDTVIRTDLATQQTEDVSSQMDVALFIQRRMNHKTPSGVPKKAIFGTPGNEIWYGGNFNNNNLAAVWAMIESETGLLETDHELWPLTDGEKRGWFPLKVDDFTEDLSAPLLDENGDVVKKHKYNINWRNISGITSKTITDILDPNVVVDKRTTKSAKLSTVLTTKTI